MERHSEGERRRSVNCARSEELLSDFVERTLAPPLTRELEGHLGECPGCTDLLSSLREVLGAFQELPVPDPPENLVERVLERTRPVLRAARVAEESSEAELETPFWRHAAAYLAAAALLGGLLLWRPPEFLADASRRVSQTAHQAYSFGVRTYHQTERWVEDLNVLRMTVGVAFENRLDRLSERLRDLEDARRRTEQDEDDSSRSGLATGGDVASSRIQETRSLS
jgi:hypothetical protein